MGVAFKVTPASQQPDTGGHGRGTTSDERETQPRVPIIGLDAGCIPGTKPGSSAREIDRCAHDLAVAGRELVRRKLRKARGRA